MATLPQQAPGPGPTAQALPSYLSYSAAATNTIQYTSTITQVVYDPQGGFAPYQTTSVVQGTTTQVDYTVVNVPLLYTGPFPALDLGTLYTTPGQSLTPSATPSATTGGSNSGSPAASTAVASTTPTDTATATPSDSTTASPTETSPATTNSPSTPASTQESSLSAESAPSTAPPESTSSNPTAAQTTSPTTTATSPTVSSTLTSATAATPSSSFTPASTNTNPTSTNGTSSNNPSATAAGLPNPNNFASNGLSGGQIAGIVLGAFFFLLLLLLLLLCCLRRRRQSKREQQAVLAAATGGGGGGRSQAGGGARGNYAALGGGAGAGAAGAAGGTRRASVGSDDWEEDHLTGGGGSSGFFVVGDQRLGPDRRASIASRRSRASATTNYHSYSPANVPPPSTIQHSGAKTAGFAGLAAAAAGFLGVAFGRKRQNSGGRVEIEEEQPLSDDDLGDGSVAERRGLMPFHDSPGYGSGAEMREASPGVASGGPAAAVVRAGAGYAAAQRRGQPAGSGSSQRAAGAGAGSMSRATSSAFSGSGSSSHTTGATGSSPASNRLGGDPRVSSSNSTGGFTTSGSGTSLPFPPRAPRGSPQSSAATATYGNVEPSSSATSYASPADMRQNPRFSADTTDSATSGLGSGAFNHPALLGLGGGAALGGLAALAAGHRDSDGSTYSRRRPPLAGSEVRGSYTSEMSADDLNHLRSTDPERYSRFISSGSNLLGPNYQPSPDLEGTKNAAPSADPEAGTLAAGTTASVYPRSRLATIRSVGEFGEKSDSLPAMQSSRTASSQPFSSTGASGSLGASSARSRVISPLPVYEAQQSQAGETLPNYSVQDPPRRPSEVSDAGDTGRFVTPPDSPRNTLGDAMSEHRPSSDAHRYADDDGESNVDEDAEWRDDARGEGTELAEAGVASTSILGGVAAGWRRLTMGQYAWVPGASLSRNQNAPSSHRGSSLDDLEGRISQDRPQRNVSEDSSRLVHQRRASRTETSDAGLAPEVPSQRASVYGASIGGRTSGSLPHGSSKDVSGSSGEQAMGGVGVAAQRSHPSLSSQGSSARSRGGGYAASHSNSSGRRTTSDNSGLDSLSAVAQGSQSTGSGSSRSGYRSRGGRSGGALSEVSSTSAASTGAASYSPSGVLSRGNTSSTRDGTVPTGNATYHPSGYEGSSMDTGGAATSDFASSRATGGSSAEKRKRPRSSSGDGLSRLDSLREVQEADPFDDTIPPLPPTGHYPSESLGAAVSRSAAREQSASDSGYLQSQALPRRSRIRSLQPGTSAPAPTVLAPSLSTPSLCNSRTDLDTAEAEQLTPAIPASASWRPSPRVASASQLGDGRWKRSVVQLGTRRE
ncbi:hypothetical protein [Sporisorium scitamineum]|uniref:Uncharacterized protein n=1 Tax=Sporisorium scitamineum TaxID=49012 RepID=A0A0F7S852_9BASI|nr:hypothetical protein [Sporisorium scitamineum]